MNRNRLTIFLIFISPFFLLTGCLRATQTAPTLPNSQPNPTATSAPTGQLSSLPTVKPDGMRTHSTDSPLTQTPPRMATSTATLLAFGEGQTPTPWPTATPLVPSPASDAYRLTEWTPEKAAILIETLKSYSETLYDSLRARWKDGYYASFRYAGLTELENALRFPEAEQRQVWEWDGAHLLYQSSNEDAGSIFADLTAKALNKNETSLQEIDSWLEKVAPFDLTRYPIKPPSGYQSSLVLSFKSREGGFAIWLVEKNGKFYGFPLKNGRAIGDSNFDTVDINGDGISEAIIQNIEYQNFGMHAGGLTIYRLDHVPPQPVGLSPALFEPEIATWSVDKVNATINFHIPISTTVDAPCYSYMVNPQYQWQAGTLKITQLMMPPKSEMEQNAFCTRILAHTLGTPRYLENQITLDAFKTLLDLPFIEKISEAGWEFPLRIDEERLKLAIFLSDHGDEAGAYEQIQKIRDNTSTEYAQWRKNALDFYTARRSPQALFQFCLTSQVCDTFFSHTKILSIIPPKQFNQSQTLLTQMGIPVFSSGDYDFDLDGQLEKWLFFKDATSSCSGEFWIIAIKAGVIHSRLVDYPCISDESDLNSKIDIKPLGLYQNLPYYQATINGKEILSDPFLYWPLEQKDPAENYWQTINQVNTLQIQLLLGQLGPSEAQDQLKALQKVPVESDLWSTNHQAQLRYLIGLCQELSGDSESAAETYLQLWKTYPDDPFALMAFAKLEPVQ